MDENKNCGCKEGMLPSCAPLAMAYVPMQQSVKPVYSNAEALSRGTLFPGLDLPFMNMVNTGDMTGTPLGEVMALDFVAHELALYLDTHSEDGPLTKSDLSKAQSYTWLKNPWPWDYCAKKEG